MNDRYFGSDLNKFIHENCRKDMTVNNIDLIMMRHNVQYAKATVLRIIESKHMTEKNMSNSQRSVHFALANVLRNAKSDSIKYEHYIIRGSPPYEQCKIINMLTARVHYIIDIDELTDFLNFEIELN